MEVNATMLGQLKQPWLQNLAVRNNHDHVRLQRLEKRVHFGRLERLRLENPKMQVESALLYRRSLERVAPAAGFVGLRNDTGDSVASFKKAIERRQRELRAAHEHKLYSHLPWRISFLMRRLIMSRLIKLM